MPDERWVEALFERAMQGLGSLTNQVARLAYAIEVKTSDSRDAYRTCPTCNSRIQLKAWSTCKACGQQWE